MNYIGEVLAVLLAVVLAVVLFLATSFAMLSDKDGYENGERKKGPSGWTVGWFIATVSVPLFPLLLAEFPVLDSLTLLAAGPVVLIVLLMVSRRFIFWPLFRWVNNRPHFGD